MRKCVSRIVVVGLCLGAWLSSSSAQTIINPSFETDVFPNFPGYISGNSAITGWTAGNNSRAGINVAGGPFANNGTIPAGSQVAFIQNGADASLSNLISGLTIGQTYKVNFRVNARGGNTPNLKVDIDGSNLINTAVTSVGGANAYKYFAFDFTATATEHLLALRNDAGGDHTVLIDDFSIAVRNSGWSYAAWNDDATSGVDGTKTHTHAFSFGSGVNTTINGIVFTGVGGGNPSGPTFSTTGLPNVFPNDANNLTGGSDVLANDFVYANAELFQSITLNGLIPGAEYVANIYSVGWENGTRAATFSVGSDRLTVNQDQFGDNNGIRFTYRYIAAGSSITLTYTRLQGSSIHTYGFSNYELNAPPTAPQIVANPSGRCVSEGQPFTLSGSASGSPVPSYQWQKDGSDLIGATSSSYSDLSAAAGDAGSYTLIASNASGTATSTVAVVKIGLAMVNPSFEVDTFVNFPGYVSGNGPITGWSSLGNHGINTGAGPFANNGAIPDRNQVAFMQGDGAMSQTVSGFTIGAQYYVVYFENARNGGIPAIELQIGGTTIVPAHSRAPVGGGNPYVQVTSDPFIASATDLLLSFIKSNPNGGDTTALIDNVCILPLPAGTPPSVSRQPQSRTVKVGDNASFTVGPFGSLPFTYQWRKDGANITDATNVTLALLNVAKSAEADYTVVVANSSGSVTSAVARLTVTEPISTLFNTGIDTNGLALGDGLVDPHYVLLSNPDTGSPDAIVEDSTAFPIVGGPWLGNTASSKWIGPRLNTSASAVGFYTNRTTFDLTDRDPGTVFIIGRWASDNSGRDIRVNGVSTGNPQSTTFAGYTTFNISTSNASFLPGVNTIDFVVENEAAPGYTGLRVEFTASNARILPNVRPVVTLQPASQTEVIEGSSVTFTVGATGSDPLVYQWNKGGVPLPGQTNTTLTLNNVTTNDNGFFDVQVSNGSGSTNSLPAQLAVIYRRVPGIYSTGTENSGALAADGSIDQHWIIGSSVDPTNTGPDAIVINQSLSPVPPWLSAGPKSKWIAPQANQNAGNAEGNYTYQTFFDLTGVDMCTFRLAGQFAVDNSLLDIVVNGVSQGVSGGGFTSFVPFVVTNGFVAGPNTVDFIMNNAPTTPNPTALRVDLDGLVRIRSILAPTLSITRTAPDTLSISWTPTGGCDRLQSATDVTGPWTTISTVSPTTAYTTNAPATFFRVLP